MSGIPNPFIKRICNSGKNRKWSTILRLLRNPLSNSKRRIFQIPPDGVLQQSRKILREIHKNSHNLKIGFVYRKNALERIRTSDLYLRLEMNHTGWTKAHLHYSSTSPKRNRTDAPYNYSGNTPFFMRPLSKCAQFSGRYLIFCLF